MARRPKKRILVVEDDGHLRASITEILTLNGYLASGSEDGKAALDRLEQSPTPPALILLDLHMPVMDGMTFLQRLRAIPRLRPIPVLLMTAQSSPPPLEVAAILLKPFALNSLLSLVKQWATVKQRKYKRRRGVAVRGTRT